MSERSLNKKEVVEFLKIRIAELTRFEGYSGKDIEAIRDQKTRAKLRLCIATLDVNKRLLEKHMKDLLYG
jgi:hypothetical protein